VGRYREYSKRANALIDRTDHDDHGPRGVLRDRKLVVDLKPHILGSKSGVFKWMGSKVALITMTR